MTGGAAAGQPITIGAFYNLTGAQQNLDIPSAAGARLAVDEANKGKGVLGLPVSLILVDGKTDPMAIARDATRLFKQHPDVAGLIGFSDTDMVMAAAPIAARNHRVFLTSGATSPELPARVPTYLFLACFGDNVQAAAGAEWAYTNLKSRTVAVLYNAGMSYTRLLHRYFQTRFKQLGGKVVSVQAYRAANLKAKIAVMPKADLVYFASSPSEVTTGIPLLRAAGVTAPIMGGDSFDIGADWGQVPAAKDVYFTTHAYLGADNPDPEVQRFRRLYAAAHPGQQPDAFTALGYDAARLLLAAIEAAGSAKPDAVRKALAATHDFHGVTGTITYRGGSRIPVKSVTVMQVEDVRQIFRGSFVPEKVPAP